MLTITDIVNCVSDQIESGSFNLAADDARISEEMVALLIENDHQIIAADSYVVDDLVDEALDAAYWAVLHSEYGVENAYESMGF